MGSAKQEAESLLPRGPLKGSPDPTPQAREEMLLPELGALPLDGQSAMNIALALGRRKLPEYRGELLSVSTPPEQSYFSSDELRAMGLPPHAKLSKPAVGGQRPTLIFSSNSAPLILASPSPSTSERMERRGECKSDPDGGFSVFEQNVGFGGDACCDLPDPNGSSASVRGHAFFYRYRDTEFCVPYDWWLRYSQSVAGLGIENTDSTSMVSSINDTLSALWYPYDSSASPSFSDLASVIGCFNLPYLANWDDEGRMQDTDAQRYIFWRKGYAAPYRYILNVLKLIAQHTDDIVDEYTGVDWCEGFGDFCRQYLTGGRPEGRSNFFDGCKMRLVVGSADPEFDDQWVVTDCSGVAVERRRRCTDFPQGCEGTPWHEWTMTWNTEKSIWAVLGSGGGLRDNPSPGESCDPGMTSWSKGQIWMHASDLAFRARSADHIMFFARMAYDFSRDPASGTRASIYYLKAMQLARYVLRRMIGLGTTIIHEMGHDYLRSCHCPWRCCYDIAAHRWECKMLGRLGLPLNGVEAHIDGDYPFAEQRDWNLCDTCSNDDSSDCKHDEATGQRGAWADHDHGFYGHLCAVTVVGRPGAEAVFCSEWGCVGGCDDSSCTADECTPGRTPDWTCGYNEGPCLEYCLAGNHVGHDALKNCREYCSIEGSVAVEAGSPSSCVEICIRSRWPTGAIPINAFDICAEECGYLDDVEGVGREDTRGELYP